MAVLNFSGTVLFIAQSIGVILVIFFCCILSSGERIGRFGGCCEMGRTSSGKENRRKRQVCLLISSVIGCTDNPINCMFLSKCIHQRALSWWSSSICLIVKSRVQIMGRTRVSQPSHSPSGKDKLVAAILWKWLKVNSDMEEIHASVTILAC